ncbi:toxin-antitoxin system YwqK family antitoxin [Bacteroidota bacterium]
MRTLLIICLAFSVQLLSAQELLNTHKNESDAQGRKQGYWKVFDVNGNLKFEGAFKDNIPYGDFIYYYPKGSIRAKSFIYNNGTESRTKTYHENGKLMASGKYLNKEKDSIWNYYSDFDGVLLAEEIYENNIKTGTWRKFFPDGSIAETLIYVNNIKNGPWRQYFPNAQLKLKADYVDGNIQGLMTIYHPNGEVHISGNYKNNIKEGAWMYFNDSKENYKMEIYEYGKLTKTEEYETMYEVK